MRKTNQTTVITALVLPLLALAGCDYDSAEESRNYLAGRTNKVAAIGTWAFALSPISSAF